MRVKEVGMANINTVISLQPSPVIYLQQRYCLSYAGGKTRVFEISTITAVLNGSSKSGLEFLEKKDAELRMARDLENTTIACSKPYEAIKDFFVHPATTVYRDIACDPRPQSNGVLNLWVGHTTKPKKGDWSQIRYFLEKVICGGNQQLFLYLVQYLAHALQRPEEKPGVCIVLIGGEGVGKGSFFKLLGTIWSFTTLLIQDIDSVVGAFNKAIEGKFILCMDEALFAGNKAATDKLKSFITEPMIRIGGKYEPERSCASFHRMFASTNRSLFAHIRNDDRRFLFIEVSDIHKQDYEYFSGFNRMLEDGSTVASFVYHLQKRNLTGFQVRSKPNTKVMLQQKLRSLSGFSRYWYEVLQSQDFNQGISSYSLPTQWSEACWISSQELKSKYLDYDKNSQRHQSAQKGAIYHDLKQLCPSSSETRKDDKRGVALPHIDVARKEFEAWFGHVLQWD
jgi:hypothetical protein